MKRLAFSFVLILLAIFAVAQCRSVTIFVSTIALPSGNVGTVYSQTVSATGGAPPYEWSLPGGAIAAGAQDVLDYALMKLPDRQSFHLSGNAVKYFKLDAGIFFWEKGASGEPWDGEYYDGNFIYQGFTEDVFSDPKTFKRYETAPHIWPRYHVPGNDDVIVDPGPNVYDIYATDDCSTHTTVDNKDVKGELQGPFTDVTWQTTYGGDIPNGTPYLLATKYYLGTSGVYQAADQYWLVLGWGQVRWCPLSWNGSGFTAGTCSTNTSKVAGGAPTPNFACGIQAPPTNALPPGSTLTSGPSLNIDESTGVISGTPTTAGVYPFSVQVEDSLGNIAQKNLSITINP